MTKGRTADEIANLFMERMTSEYMDLTPKQTAWLLSVAESEGQQLSRPNYAIHGRCVRDGKATNWIVRVWPNGAGQLRTANLSADYERCQQEAKDKLAYLDRVIARFEQKCPDAIEDIEDLKANRQQFFSDNEHFFEEGAPVRVRAR